MPHAFANDDMPRMATLLCLITTDLAIDTHLLTRAIEQSVPPSFGSLSIDGDRHERVAFGARHEDAIVGKDWGGVSGWQGGPPEQVLLRPEGDGQG